MKIRLTYDNGYQEEWVLGEHVHYSVYPHSTNMPGVVFPQGVLAVGPEAEEAFGDHTSRMGEWGTVHEVWKTVACSCADVTIPMDEVTDAFGYEANGDQPSIELLTPVTL